MAEQQNNHIPVLVLDAGENIVKLKACLRYPDYLIRQGAALQLGNIGSFECLAPLTDALHDPDSVVREAAATGLGRIKELPNIHRKLTFFEEAPDDVVALHDLTRALNDREYRVRIAAAKSLERFGYHHEVESDLPANSDEVLREVDQEAGIQYSPYSYPVADGKWKPVKRVYPPLIRDHSVPEEVLRANYNLSIYKEQLAKGNPDVREAVAWALGVMRDLDGVSLLIMGLRDPVDMVRQTAAHSIGLIDYSSLKKDRSSRFADKQADQLAIQNLLKALKDTDIMVRVEAITALAVFHRPEIIRTLMSLVTDSIPEIRIAALQGCGKQQDTILIDSLFNGLRDPYPAVQIAALDALGELLQKCAISSSEMEKVILELNMLRSIKQDNRVDHAVEDLLSRLQKLKDQENQNGSER